MLGAGHKAGTGGVLKYAPGGKIDFHACRVAYTNMLHRAGADVKTSQEMARHSTPTLTMNTYGRARIDRMADVAEQVGAMVLARRERPTGGQQKAASTGSPVLAAVYMVEDTGVESNPGLSA